MGYINSIISTFNRRLSIQTLEEVFIEDMKAFQTCIQLWSPVGAGPEEGDRNYQKDEHLSCENSLREWGFFSQEKALGRCYCGLSQGGHSYLKGTYTKDGDKPFSRTCCERTRDEIYEDRFRLDIRKKIFLQWEW